MTSIVVGASKPIKSKILAWFIMWWEETPASHVYFYLKRESGIHLLYQAVGSGTEFMGYCNFITINQPIYEKEIEISEEQLSKLLDYLIPKLKTKYSLTHLAGLFFKRLAYYFFNEVIANPFADKGKSAVCVEALCTMLNDETIYKTAMDPEDMGMKEAMVMMQMMPGKVIIQDGKSVDGKELRYG